ncbi:hypothetical protein K1719_034438 [Acacia pycnantha]|nr:hypothetical protein K1719_034438 [Acacia pycnantha]
MNKINDYPKPHSNPLIRLLVTGLTDYEGEKSAKHRKIINPAFNVEKLKIMLGAFYESFNDMVDEWEKMLSTDGTCEVDVPMILYEVMRLCRPILLLTRTAHRDMKLGHLTVLARMEALLLVGLVHRDCELWGMMQRSSSQRDSQKEF